MEEETPGNQFFIPVKLISLQEICKGFKKGLGKFMADHPNTAPKPKCSFQKDHIVLPSER